MICADKHNLHIVPVQYRSSLLPGYPVDWRDSLLLAPMYPVDWRDSVLWPPRHPGDWQDSVFRATRYPEDWRDSVLLAPQVPCALWTGGTQSFWPPGTLWTLAGLNASSP